MPGTASGVSGAVQYDADLTCHADDHGEGQQMYSTDELSDQGNSIFECPVPGGPERRAVNLSVRRVGPGEEDGDADSDAERASPGGETHG